MLIRRQGEAAWLSPEIEAYENEQALQTLLEQSPALLPGSDGAMAIAAELALPDSIAADLVGVDRGGQITIVECKLRANPEIRRTVVGQLFAYAARLWKLPYESFDAAFRARAGSPLTDYVAALEAGGANDSWQEATFRQAVEANLGEGRFRLVVAVDAITDELKRTVEYLNAHTFADVQVLALELRYVSHAGVEILQPTVYGEESVRAKAASSSKQRVGRWDETSLLEALAERCSTRGVEAVRRLFESAEALRASFNWGTGKTMPSVTVWLPDTSGKPAYSWSCYAYPTGPSFDVNFDFMRDRVPAQALALLASRLRAIPGVADRFVGIEAAEFRRRPSLPIDGILAQPGAAQIVEAAFVEMTSREPDSTYEH